MRLRFTIRDLLWLAALVALAAAWWVDRNNLIEDRQRGSVEFSVLQKRISESYRWQDQLQHQLWEAKNAK